MRIRSKVSNMFHFFQEIIPAIVNLSFVAQHFRHCQPNVGDMDKKLYFFENLKKFGENRCITWKENIAVEQVFNYNEVIKSAELITSVFNEIKVVKESKILVNIGHSPVLLPLILSILNKSCCYCPVDIEANQIADCLERYRAKYFVSDKPIVSSSATVRSLKVFYGNLHILEFEKENFVRNIQDDSLCYAVQTSGSTGEPKIVSVPYSCILPNILSLNTKFSVQSQDVIFVSSPPTFDPFMVDIFLALMRGASVLLVPTAVRLLPDLLVRLMFPENGHSTTICQLTPSLFRRFSSESIKDYIFAETSTLRILVLGGEEFPSAEEIRSWPVWTGPKKPRIFNIYGITEVSCWSSIEEVVDVEIETTLGDPLDSSTVFEVRSNDQLVANGIGELYIGSCQRKCLLENESEDMVQSADGGILFRATGDVVERRNEKIYYKNRSNAVIKRFGCKVNLKGVEDKIKKTDNAIIDVCCVFDAKNTELLAFVQINEADQSNISLHAINKNLNKTEQPDHFKFLSKLPLSCHGKVSKLKLLEQYRMRKDAEAASNREHIVEIFKQKLNESLRTLTDFSPPPDKKPKTDFFEQNSFLNAGGTSFIALRLIGELEEIACATFPKIFEMLLDENCSLDSVVKELKNSIHNRIDHVCDPNPKSSQLQLKKRWKSDLKKCIDASATIGALEEDTRTIVAIGSHSHRLACFDTENGSNVTGINLPDRIEGQVSIVGRDGIVGCYDGALYKFNIKSGEIMGRFDSGGMIKCRPLIVEGRIIFGNYSSGNNLFCLDFENLAESWSLKVGSKSIFASPILLNDNFIICATLDGVVAKIQYRTGIVDWRSTLESPIFSTAIRLSENSFIVAEVSGKVHYFQYDQKISSYQCNGSIFSSLTRLEGANKIIFGCYDRCLYCVKFDEIKTTLELNWKVQLQSQIYSTPKIMNFASQIFAICCTTNGQVNVIEISKGAIVQSVALDGEIFSSPAIHQNRIFVGCRDNFFYCLEVEEKAG